MAQNRIATIDLRKVFDGYWKEEAEAALKSARAISKRKTVTWSMIIRRPRRHQSL